MYQKWTGLIAIIVVIMALAAVAAPALAAPAAQADQDIVEIAVADGRFTTLVSALQTANLVGTLQGEGPFTVFAPTDDAFNKLPDGALDDLVANPDRLADVLLYHVVPGKVLAADVVNLDAAATVFGEPVDIQTMGNSVMVNEAQVVITDIEASNGVIHVIDTVLLPPAEQAPPALPQTGGELNPSSSSIAMIAVGLLLVLAGFGVRYSFQAGGRHR